MFLGNMVSFIHFFLSQSVHSLKHYLRLQHGPENDFEPYLFWCKGRRGQEKVKERINKHREFYSMCSVNPKCCSSWPPSGNQLQVPKSDVPVLGQAWGFLPVGCCDGLPGHFLHSLACPLGRHATLQLSGSSSHTYAAICPLLSWEVPAPPKGWRTQKRKSKLQSKDWSCGPCA